MAGTMIMIDNNVRGHLCPFRINVSVEGRERPVSFDHIHHKPSHE